MRLKWKRFQRWLHSLLPYKVKKKYSPDQVTDQVALVGTWLILFTVFILGIKLMFSTVKGPVAQRTLHRKPVSSPKGMPGLDKRLADRYVPDVDGNFQCLSGDVVPFDQVNDDFCDCPLDDRASDEPSTGACRLQKFHCDGEAKTVPSSRVNDGICDCCDGSDEWKGLNLINHLSELLQAKLHRYQSPCPNVCDL